MELNEQQKKVIYATDHFLFLLAGAGSGKTTVIIEKIKYLLQHGVKEEEILAITFTRKASNEMKKRLNLEKVTINTFHQFCLTYLKKHKDYNYNIVNQEQLTFDKEQLLYISKFKNSFYKTKKPKQYEQYQAYLKDNKMKDFDDILLDFYVAITKQEIYAFYKYIFVDEFQDTNLLQYMILRKLISSNNYVLAVGDPDQSIYMFRGARADVIYQYVKDYQAKIYLLNTNYRSTKKVVSLANGFIKQNTRKFKKMLIASKKDHGIVLRYQFNDQYLEAAVIIEAIKKYEKMGIRNNDIAILFRQHSRSYILKEQLFKNNIEYNQKNDIQLLTVHQAKGLEFDVVFLIGLEKNEFPNFQVINNDLLEEERRLMFVAITRARLYLNLTYVTHDIYGKTQKPSSFYREFRKVKIIKST